VKNILTEVQEILLISLAVFATLVAIDTGTHQIVTSWTHRAHAADICHCGAACDTHGHGCGAAHCSTRDSKH
jgi:hypothetical protein